MSTTAGVGLGEYRAVNGLAVTALVLGIASWMSWLHPMLFLLPLLGVMFGVLAIVQVRRSNGTQSGGGLATAGMILSLGLGGWAMLALMGERAELRNNRAEIAELAEGFGIALAAGNFDAAYDLTDVNFQRRVTREAFRTVLTGEQARLRGIRGAGTNNRARITTLPDSPATAEAVLDVETGLGQPLRQNVGLIRREEGWRFTELPAWFS